MANANGFKVAVVGAAGGIGQPLSLLLKQNPKVGTLHLYDVVNTPGVAADLSHMDTDGTVAGFVGNDQMADALKGMDLVVIPAGVPRKPGMTRDDLFNINAGILKGICEGIATNCPNAFVNIISNPVNSTVPIAAEVFKKHGCYDKKKLFGVTHLDVVRANTFVAEKMGVPRSSVSVPVIGGHAGITILPVLSQSTPKPGFDAATIKALTERIQNAGTEVVEAKAGLGSATLSMAYAAAQFADSCLTAMSGGQATVCAYVDSTLVPELPFFSSVIDVDSKGVSNFHPIGALSDAEKANLEALKGELKGSIDKGVAFANK